MPKTDYFVPSAGQRIRLPKIFWVQLLTATASLFVLTATYWFLLIASHNAARDYVQEQTSLRAARLAQALTVEVDTQFSGLATIMHTVSSNYLAYGMSGAILTANSAIESLPAGTIFQIGITDAEGNVLFSTVWQGKPPGKLPNISHHDHFKAQKDGSADGLFINGPIIGTLAQQASLALSLPIRQGGKFKGVVVLGVNPSYLTRQFEKVLNNPPHDVAMLLNSTGRYMARSGEVPKNILSLSVPDSRKFLTDSTERSGRYIATAAVDGIERFYAWSRLEHYPMIISVGLNKKQATQEHDRSTTQSISHNIIGSIIIWMGFALTGWLFFSHQRNAIVLAENKERLGNLVAELPVGLFQFRSGSDLRFPMPFLYVTAKAWELHGVEPGAVPQFLHDLRRLIHAEDFRRLFDAFRQSAASLEPFQETYRLLKPGQGRTRWLRIYIKPDKTSEDDTLIWHGYVHDISEELEHIRLIHALLDNSAAVILTASADRKIRHINARAQETLLPKKLDEAAITEQGLSFRMIHLNDQSFENFNQYYNILRATGHVRCEYQMRDNTGQPRWFDVHGSILDPDDPESDVIWTCIDIDSRRHAEHALARTRAHLGAVISRFPDGVLVEERDRNEIFVVNETLCQVLQIPQTVSEITGRSWSDFIHCLAAEKRACFELQEGQSLACYTVEHQLDAYTTLQVDHIPLLEKEQSLGTLWVLRDISERKERERSLETLAATDSLTGLPNRRTFINHLNETIIAVQQGYTTSCILVMIDLDHFKEINDTWGHALGDEVLRSMSQVLQAKLRRSDLPGRIGGEEFAILLHSATPQIGLRLMDRLREEFASQRIPAPDGKEISFTASLGLTEINAETESAEQALARADEALYTAKRTGRDRVVFWDNNQISAHNSHKA